MAFDPQWFSRGSKCQGIDLHVRISSDATEHKHACCSQRFFSWRLNTVVISTASNLQEHGCEQYHLSETWAKNDMIKVPVFKVM